MIRAEDRAALDGMRHDRRAAAPAPTPAPPPAPTPPPADASIQPAIEHALLTLAAQQRDTVQAVLATNQAILEVARKPKRLQADIVRDDDKRMTQVIITVLE